MSSTAAQEQSGVRPVSDSETAHSRFDPQQKKSMLDGCQDRILIEHVARKLPNSEG